MKPSPRSTSRSQDFFCEDVSVQRLSAAVQTPFYLYSAAAFLKPLREMQNELKGHPHQIFFAVKANSNIAILNLLYQAGAGLDIVSGGELYRAGQIWASGGRIVFSGVGKSDAEILAALQFGNTGIRSFHVESEAELRSIERIAGELRKPAPVLLRFNPDVNAKTHPYIATGLRSGKFGLSRSKILAIVKSLADSPWIKLEGISIHIGSGIGSLGPFREAFLKARDLLDELNIIRKKQGADPLTVADLGGGLAAPYGDCKSPPSLKSYCQLIKKVFFTSRKGFPTYEVLLEPGKSIAAEAGMLITKVLYRKEGHGKDFLIVDASMSELIRPALYGGNHEIVSLEKKTGKKTKTDVVGPVCESADFLGKARMLPKSICAGDRLAILSAGAYGMSMASRYNSRPLPAEILVTGKSYRVIRYRENYEDLVDAETV